MTDSTTVSTMNLKLWHLLAVTIIQIVGFSVYIGIIYGSQQSHNSEMERRIGVVESRQQESDTWRGQVMEELGKIEGEILESNRERQASAR